MHVGAARTAAAAAPAGRPDRPAHAARAAAAARRRPVLLRDPGSQAAGRPEPGRAGRGDVLDVAPPASAAARARRRGRRELAGLARPARPRPTCCGGTACCAPAHLLAMGVTDLPGPGRPASGWPTRRTGRSWRAGSAEAVTAHAAGSRWRPACRSRRPARRSACPTASWSRRWSGRRCRVRGGLVQIAAARRRRPAPPRHCRTERARRRCGCSGPTWPAQPFAAPDAARLRELGLDTRAMAAAGPGRAAAAGQPSRSCWRPGADALAAPGPGRPAAAVHRGRGPAGAAHHPPGGHPAAGVPGPGRASPSGCPTTGARLVQPGQPSAAVRPRPANRSLLQAGLGRAAGPSRDPAGQDRRRGRGDAGSRCGSARR